MLICQRRPAIFWQVYSDRYVDQMGIIGYFPATVVKEIHKFKEDMVTIPTTVSRVLAFIRKYLMNSFSSKQLVSNIYFALFLSGHGFFL